jgi:hypothetical protein
MNVETLSRPDGGAPARRAPPFVVVVRVLLLAAAAAALASGVVRACSHDRAASLRLERYVCPMHPEVVRPVPGDCPICNMALVPERAAALEAPFDGGEITARAERRFVTAQVRAAASVGADGEGTAVLYEDDLVGLGPREPALFFGGASPNMGIAAHLELESQSPIDASTVNVRFRLDEAREAFPASVGPIDVGSLHIAARARNLLTVPRSAVLHSAQGAYVLAASPAGHAFEKRTIRIGRILDSGYVGGHAGAETGAIVVLAGLEEGERLIAGYTFFIDSERRLRETRNGAAEVNR